jgi:site-specific recombinase XerD
VAKARACQRRPTRRAPCRRGADLAVAPVIIRDIESRGATFGPTKTQLPATIQQAEITADQRALNVVPALIADLGDEAGWRYVEFSTANIRNPHTRRAYARACARFFAWCEQRGLTLTAIRPFDLATYIEGLQKEHSASGVKQQLAAVRMLFDWLITGQVLPTNPAAAVRGPKHIVKTGKTRGAGWTIRLHEKGGKQHSMPCHHALAEALRAYIDAAGTSDKPMSQPDAWRMIRRRAAAAGIAAEIGCHTFRATGITAYLSNGGALDHAQEMAAHESPRTTKLYDRTKERLTQDEVERIRL